MKLFRNVGRIFRNIQEALYHNKLVMIIAGAVSLVWLLVRVIPKPSRATYPCMRAAAPMASAFVIYLISLSGSFLFFKKAWKAVRARKYFMAIAMIAVVAVFMLVSMLHNQHRTFAGNSIAAQIVHLPANEPMGVAKGIYPGRVVWVHDPSATNTALDPSEEGKSYWEDSNTDQEKVNVMLSTALRELTGAGSDEAAWDSVFMFYNLSKGKGKVGYVNTEKIFIKLNATSTWGGIGWGNIDLNDFSRVYNSYYGLSETLPQLVTSVLDQLVNKAGVPQDRIYIADPMKHIYQDNLLRWKADFPNVHYLDHDNTYSGREIAAKSTTAKIFYSDKGTVITETEDYLYSIFSDAEYVLNLPTLKGHKHAGVTMFAKNHFGSQTRDGASHLHKGLVHTQEWGGDYRTDYGMYRVQVDLMGHPLLSGKNLVYIMDAFYSTFHELERPVKWKMAPFNNHWTSSIFASFDPVAIESVGFDFLYAEFSGRGYNAVLNLDTANVAMGAVDDYLEQAADASNWPDGITYDPDGDGVPIPSLGVHEHWDSPLTKRYSRNLGTGNGIELDYVEITQSGLPEIQAEPVTVYPNPFSEILVFDLSQMTNKQFSVSVYTMEGKLVFKTQGTGRIYWNVPEKSGNRLVPGQYFYQIMSDSKVIKSGKIIYSAD